MAKKNMDILLVFSPKGCHSSTRTDLTSLLGILRSNRFLLPTLSQASDLPHDEPWRHFSFICSKELVDKVQSIARKEGFTIRSFMEYVMKQGVEAYESKYGKVKKIRTKSIREIM